MNGNPDHYFRSSFRETVVAAKTTAEITMVPSGFCP